MKKKKGAYRLSKNYLLSEVKEQLQNHKIKNHLDLDLYIVGTILAVFTMDLGEHNANKTCT